MAAKLERTKTPGIYRRHATGCERGRCDCAYVVIWKHRGRQHTATFRTLAEAREAKGNRDAGDTRPASREPFADYARSWLDSYRGRTARGLAERTRRTYRRDLERWAIPYFRGRRLEEVEPPDVRAFVHHLERANLRPTSIRAILAPVKAMYATAVEDGAVRFNPTRGLRIADTREPDQEARALTRAELTRLLGHVPERWRLLFELLAHTGLRISEAIGLTWADVEFGDRPRLRVQRQDCRGEVGGLKSEHSRRDLPLSSGMARRLWAVGADRPGTGRVFTSPLGLPLSYGNLRRRVLVPAAREDGLSWVTFHTFRHTCASLLFEAGRDVKQVATWLGHADPAFTLRTYVHLMDDGIGDADFLDAAVTTDPARVNSGSTRRIEAAANLAAAESTESRD
jgi:integrase